MHTRLTGAGPPVCDHVHAIGGAGQAVVRVVGGGRAVGVHHGSPVPGGQSNAGHQGWRGGDTGHNLEELLIQLISLKYNLLLRFSQVQQVITAQQ